MPFVFFALSFFLFLSAQSFIASSTPCMLLVEPYGITSSWVQSSAYLCVLMSRWFGMQSLRSSTWALNNVGDITDPWRTQEGQCLIDNRSRAPPNFTCWLLPSRKLRVHSQKFFDTFFLASFLKSKPSSSRSNALQKSINNDKTWIPFFHHVNFQSWWTNFGWCLPVQILSICRV